MCMKHCSKHSHHILMVITEKHLVVQSLLHVLTKLRDRKRVGKFILTCALQCNGDTLLMGCWTERQNRISLLCSINTWTYSHHLIYHSLLWACTAFEPILLPVPLTAKQLLKLRLISWDMINKEVMLLLNQSCFMSCLCPKWTLLYCLQSWPCHAMPTQLNDCLWQDSVPTAQQRKQWL